MPRAKLPRFVGNYISSKTRLPRIETVDHPEFWTALDDFGYDCSRVMDWRLTSVLRRTQVPWASMLETE
jgi:hypothetical protein